MLHVPYCFLGWKELRAIIVSNFAFFRHRRRFSAQPERPWKMRKNLSNGLVSESRRLVRESTALIQNSKRLIADSHTLREEISKRVKSMRDSKSPDTVPTKAHKAAIVL